MKKHLFAFISLIVPAVTSAETKVSEEIETYVKQSVQNLEQSFEAYEVQKGDLLALIKELKKLGFGEAPPSPPWHRELNEAEKEGMSDADIKAQKSYLSEAKERVSRMGRKDFELLKSLDSDGDFKLQENEANKVIYDIVKEEVDKQLEVDQNADGKLTLKEYVIGISIKGEVGEDGADWHQRSHFNYEDKNKDGFIDQSEVIAYHASSFTWKSAMVLLNAKLVKSDGDKNSELSEAEFKSLFKENLDLEKVMKPLEFPVKHENLWSSFYWSNPEKLLTQLK